MPACPYSKDRLRNIDGGAMGSGAKRGVSWILVHSIEILDSVINFGRAAV